MPQTLRRRFALLLLPLILTACATTTPCSPLNGKRERGGEAEEEVFAGDMVLVVGNLENLIYDGVSRAGAKTTMVTTPVISYNTITGVTTLTPPDVNTTSPRTGVELNRAQFTAWMYAYNLPADNDFHVILGDTQTFIEGTTNLINVEVSGRPDGTDTVFKAVRQQFLNIIGNPTVMTSVYTCLPNPIAVTVNGGPFWDVSHKNGGSGTSSCYGKTPMKIINGWELHPVNSIQ